MVRKNLLIYCDVNLLVVLDVKQKMLIIEQVCRLRTGGMHLKVRHLESDEMLCKILWLFTC